MFFQTDPWVPNLYSCTLNEEFQVIIPIFVFFFFSILVNLKEAEPKKKDGVCTVKHPNLSPLW